MEFLHRSREDAVSIMSRSLACLAAIWWIFKTGYRLKT